MKSKRISLDGEWLLRWEDGERGDRLKRILDGEADWERAWTASVPGSVHETLIAHGVIPEPNLGANVLSCRWVEETIWYYRRTFRAPKLAATERALLCFETLDLTAKICLNGVEIGSHENAFRPCRIDVTDALRPGTNELVVRLESGLFSTMHRSADGFGLRINHQLTKTPWLRKTQSQHGWDWSPRLLNVGIPGGVHLEIFSGVRLDQFVALAKVSDDLRTGTVTARVFAENPGGKDVRAELVVSVDGTAATRKVAVTLKPGMNTLETNVEVPDPSLWWPVGHGSQKRYGVSAELRMGGKLVGRDSRKVGFRHVRVNQDTHPKEGQYFVLEINGKPIFCKGGNYVPADLILSRIDRARHSALIDRGLEANCNFLRVWGGGVYESDDFYDLCDERGILVWQDFVFACCKYPATDEAFLSDVTQEATWQVRRLAHHPSLVVWCGNNEKEWGAWSWGHESGVAHPDYALFHMVLPRIMREEDPSRYYQASSPFSPNHEHPNADTSGDQHPWSLGFGDNDFRKYRDMVCRFPNEGGILGPNSLPMVRASLEGGPEKCGSFAWELHDNSVIAWEHIAAYSPDKMITDWLGLRLKDLSVEEYVYWAGLLQGAGLSEYIKNFRRRMFDSAAAIFWMFNDIWPCTRSWTIVDCDLRRTPAFWPVRRAFAPVTLVLTREGDTVRCYGVNEGEELCGELRYGLLELQGAYPVDESLSVVLPANSSTVVAEFPAAVWDKLGVTTHVAFARLTQGGHEIARDTLVLPLFHEMQWPKAKVKVQWRDGKARFTCDTFAWRVCVDLDGGLPLGDNFFDILPGVPVEMAWPEEWGKPKVAHMGNELAESKRAKS
jgi:beta-mannosidase